MRRRSPPVCLILSSDGEARSTASKIVSEAGFVRRFVNNVQEIPSQTQRARCRALLLDADDLETGTGATILAEDSALAVIFLARAPTATAALTAFRSGAFDFLRKPVDGRELGAALHRVRLQYELSAAELKEELGSLIGERMRLRRYELRLTMTQLARRTRLADSVIAGAARGDSVPSLLSLFKIATALSCSLEFFFETLWDVPRVERARTDCKDDPRAGRMTQATTRTAWSGA